MMSSEPQARALELRQDFEAGNFRESGWPEGAEVETDTIAVREGGSSPGQAFSNFARI